MRDFLKHVLSEEAGISSKMAKVFRKRVESVVFSRLLGATVEGLPVPLAVL